MEDTRMNKLAFLGTAGSLKTKIIIETIMSMQISDFTAETIILFSDKSNGICSKYCLQQNIEVRKFYNIELDDQASRDIALNANVDILVSAGWPYRIPTSFLNLFKYKPINCHGSVLPDYRGNRAYMHYWANCEEHYGATIHFMNEKFDDGNVIVQAELKQFPEETPIILHRRTAELCACLLPTALSLVAKGYEGIQPDGQKRYFQKLSLKEFEEYRKYNENRGQSERMLTPHRVIVT